MDRMGNPRWLVVTAWGAFLATVPSALWRVLMIVGLMPATADLRAYELAGNPALGYAYVFGLSIVQLSTGALVLGLIRPWGERFLGHRVPVWLAVGLALIGGLAVTWIFDLGMLPAVLGGLRPDAGRTHGAALGFLIACYLPILLWGPLVIVSGLGYAARRRRTGR